MSVPPPDALAPDGPSVPRTRLLATVAVILAVLLALSTALNVLLYRSALKFYGDQMAVRLDPTDASRSLSPPETRPGQTRVVYLGDSRVDYWPSPPAPDGCQVVNRGVAGQTTGQVLLRLDRDVLALSPGVVVLQVGVNDLRALALVPGREAEIVGRCVANLRETVGRLRGRGVVVVVTTIFPVGRVEAVRRPAWSDATIDAIDVVNRALRGLAGPGVVVVDCDKILRNGRRIEPTFAADSIHLSPAGYEALAAALRPVLDRAVDEVQPR